MAWLKEATNPAELDTHFLRRVAEGILRRIRSEFLTGFVEERIALRTLHGPDPQATQMSAAKWFGEHGGIETLVVALGANNALGVVQALKLRWSGPGYDDITQKDKYNLWTPDHFAHEYGLLVDQVREIDAKHVILATVPHVTVAPILRGVGEKPYYSRYFARYTRPWISDASFDAAIHPCLTGDEARTVDSAIDQYNYTIKRFVRDARLGVGGHRPRDWYLLDLCGVLDRLAYRRYLASPQSQPDWFEPYDLPAEMLSLSPRPDARFFGSDPRGRTQGGLFALDGVHPTTIGYSIIAQEVMTIMSQLAGVEFPDESGTPVAGPARLHVDRWIARDTLITDPPTLVNELGDGMAEVNHVIDLASFYLGKAPI